MDRAERKSWLWGPWSKLGLSIALATVALDQASKWLLLSVFRIADKGRVAVTPFLDLVFVKNEGVSYGIGAGLLGQEALAVFAAAAALALAVWLARSGSSWVMAASIGLIIGGAISNGIDRLHLGGVADFFSLHAFGFYWYVFNIADVAIVAGVVGLLYDSFWPSRKDAAKAP